MHGWMIGGVVVDARGDVWWVWGAWVAGMMVAMHCTVRGCLVGGGWICYTFSQHLVLKAPSLLVV